MEHDATFEQYDYAAREIRMFGCTRYRLKTVQSGRDVQHAVESFRQYFMHTFNLSADYISINTVESLIDCAVCLEIKVGKK